MRLIIAIIFATTSVLAQTQPSLPTVQNLAALVRLRPQQVGNVSNAAVSVLNGSQENRWPAPRSFFATNGLPAWGTNIGNCFASPTNGWYWVANDSYSDTQNGLWFGMIGDGLTDNSAGIEALQKFGTNAAFSFVIPRGVYLTSRPIRFTGNIPIRIDSGSGGYATGWNPTNQVTESRIVYTGPATNTVLEIHPSSGFLYGLNLRGLTIDANGLAETAIHLHSVSRGRIEQVRARNATGRNLVIDKSFDCLIEAPSPSDNEVPFIASAEIGIAITNQSNGNIVMVPTVSGVSLWAVDVSDRSKCNSIMGGALESNGGGSIRLRESANNNYVGPIWSENQSGAYYIQIDANSIWNRIDCQYFENDSGSQSVYVDGIYNTISSSRIKSITFGPNAGRNTLQNSSLGVGEQPGGYWWRQILDNVIDASATWRTNTTPDNMAIRGQVIDFVSETNTYPSARLSSDSIKFGDGSTSLPWVGWSYGSSASILTTNGILQIVPYSTYGLWSAYVLGDAQPRLSVLPGKIILGGGGTNPPDATIQWMASRTLLLDSGILTVRPGTNDTLLSGYTTGSPNPSFRSTIDGTLAWSRGGTNPADTYLHPYGPGALRIASALYIGDTNVLEYIGSKASTNHTHVSTSIVDTTSTGRSIMTAVDATAMRTILGLGDSATKNVGTNAGTVAAGDHLHTGVYDTNGAATAVMAAHLADSDPHPQYVKESSGASTNQTIEAATIQGTTTVTNIGSDLASAGAHRILVRDATTYQMRPMTASYLKGLLDIHSSDIVDSGSLGRSILTNASIAGLMPLIGSGTPNSNVWLRGDGEWSTPPSSGSATNGILDAPSDGVMYGRLNGGWVGLDIQYVAGVSTYLRSLIDSTDEADLFGRMNLTGATPTTIDSPAVHATRVNSGGSVSSRHRLNLIGATGISLSLSDDAVNDEADLTVAIADRDWGDITSTSSGSVWTIDNGAVTKAKIENVTAGTLLGRGSASTGAPQEITPGSGLTMSGTTLQVDPSYFTGQAVQLVTVDEVALGGTDFTDEAWHNLLGTAKSGTSKTIGAGVLSSGTVLKVELAGSMAYQDNTTGNKVRVRIGPSFTITMEHSEEDSYGSVSGPWSVNLLATIKSSGTNATTLVSGYWMYHSDNGIPGGYLTYTAKTSKSGTLDTTGTNLIAADFFGDNTSGQQFTEMTCNQTIVTRY